MEPSDLLLKPALTVFFVNTAAVGCSTQLRRCSGGKAHTPTQPQVNRSALQLSLSVNGCIMGIFSEEPPNDWARDQGFHGKAQTFFYGKVRENFHESYGMEKYVRIFMETYVGNFPYC